MLQEDYLIRQIANLVAALLGIAQDREEQGPVLSRSRLDDEVMSLLGIRLATLERLAGGGLDALVAPTGTLDPGRAICIALVFADAATLADGQDDPVRAARLRRDALALWTRTRADLASGDTTAFVDLDALPVDGLRELEAQAAPPPTDPA